MTALFNALLLSAGFLLLSCQPTRHETFTMDGADFKITLKDGETHLVHKLFSNVGRKYRFDIPSMALIEVVRDTVIGGKSGKLVRSTAWEFGADSTLEYRWRQLLVREDSRLSIYLLQDSNVNSFFYGLLKRADYDTAIFFDRESFAEFPLTAGLKWNIRDSTDRFYFDVLEKEYAGKETVEWGGGSRECLVFNQTYLWARGKSWISTVGLLKAEIEYDTHFVVADSLGVILDSLQTRETFDLVALNPDPDLIRLKSEEYRKEFLDTRP